MEVQPWWAMGARLHGLCSRKALNTNAAVFNPGLAEARRMRTGGPLSTPRNLTADMLAADILDGLPHHVTGMYNTKTALYKVFVDRSETMRATSPFGIPGASGSVIAGTRSLRIGGVPNGHPSGVFDKNREGWIDDLAVWRRALTEAEIGLLFNDGEGRSVQDWINVEDQDGDRIPDLWEARHDLDPTAPDGESDEDGAGLTNLEEYRAGTHPQLRDEFQIVDVQLEDSTILLTWRS